MLCSREARRSSQSDLKKEQDTGSPAPAKVLAGDCRVRPFNALTADLQARRCRRKSTAVGSERGCRRQKIHRHRIRGGDRALTRFKANLWTQFVTMLAARRKAAHVARSHAARSLSTKVSSNVLGSDGRHEIWREGIYDHDNEPKCVEFDDTYILVFNLTPSC